MSEKQSPKSPEEVRRMQETIPADDRSIYGAFEDSSTSISGVLGGMLGLQNKDAYAIIERTNLPPEEIRVIVDMMRLAEHGIGAPKVLDRPVAVIAKVVVDYMRAKVSVTDSKGHGTSRQEVVDSLTAWYRTLEARDAQMKQQAKAGVAG